MVVFLSLALWMVQTAAASAAASRETIGIACRKIIAVGGTGLFANLRECVVAAWLARD
jgi:hypothetical protein